MPSASERVLQRANDQATHELRIPEAHFRLCRMHVHVDIARRQIEEERHNRMAVAREEILIRRANGADDQLVLHRTAIDEEMLMLARAAAERGQTGKAREPHIAAYLV